MFIVEFVGITQWDIKVVMYLLICFIMIYIECSRIELLALLFVACPALNLTILPQILTSSGRRYWKRTMSEFVYFIYVCFGYWDSSGICRKYFQVEEKVKIFNSLTSAPLSSRGYTRSEETKDEDRYYYFNHVISSTIGTRVLLLMIFKFFIPLALYVRHTCPYPIKELLNRLLLLLLLLPPLLQPLLLLL